VTAAEPVPIESAAVVTDAPARNPNRPLLALRLGAGAAFLPVPAHVWEFGDLGTPTYLAELGLDVGPFAISGGMEVYTSFPALCTYEGQCGVLPANFRLDVSWAVGDLRIGGVVQAPISVEFGPALRWRAAHWERGGLALLLGGEVLAGPIQGDWNFWFKAGWTVEWRPGEIPPPPRRRGARPPDAGGP